MIAPNNFLLAGLDQRDIVSDRHPYLHLAVLQDQAQQAHLRRARTARWTPGGMPQPPEVMGVDADARVPNPLQPMPGEYNNDGEVGGGRPGFFGALMPHPTGVANLGDLESPTPDPQPASNFMVPAVGADRMGPVPLAERDPGPARPSVRVTRAAERSGRPDSNVEAWRRALASIMAAGTGQRLAKP